MVRVRLAARDAELGRRVAERQRGITGRQRERVRLRVRPGDRVDDAGVGAAVGLVDRDPRIPGRVDDVLGRQHVADTQAVERVALDRATGLVADANPDAAFRAHRLRRRPDAGHEDVDVEAVLERQRVQKAVVRRNRLAERGRGDAAGRRLHLAAPLARPTPCCVRLTQEFVTRPTR